MAAQLLNEQQIKLIKDKAKEKDFSIYRVSVLCKITPSSVYQLMKGLVPMYPKWKTAISDVLDITDDEWNSCIVREKIDDGGDADE